MHQSITDEHNYSIDFLKVLGLFLIILAHVSIPTWLFEIRNFDVPMMVFISGYLSKNSFARSSSYLKYVKKRIVRLLIPTYIFFIVFFICYSFYMPLDSMVVIKTFLLQNNSYGFVWIIRVYLLCALIVPFIGKLDFSKNRTIFGVVIVYALYELCCQYGIGINTRVIGQTLFYVIPFGIVLLLGYCYRNFSRKIRLLVALLFTISFAVIEFVYFTKFGEFCFVQPYKYPPRHLYLVHALMYISLLMLLEKAFVKIGKNAFIVFVSRSSLWIYLWHIAVLSLVKNFFTSSFWGIKFLIVVSLSIFVVYIQNKLIDFIETKRKLPFLTVFRG